MMVAKQALLALTLPHATSETNEWQQHVTENWLLMGPVQCLHKLFSL